MKVTFSTNSLIPYSLENLVYSKHAQHERCKDTLGFIDIVPKSYFRSSCKTVEFSDNETLKVSYIFNDERDIVLIINIPKNLVVTNYLRVAKNTGIYKGRYRVSSIIKKNIKKNAKQS